MNCEEILAVVSPDAGTFPVGHGAVVVSCLWRNVTFLIKGPPLCIKMGAQENSAETNT